MSIPDPQPKPLDHLALRGDRSAIALISRDGALDYAGLDARVGAVAAALRDRGLAIGDRVASWLPKTEMAAILPLAAARAGLVHVPINPALRKAQVDHILKDSGASLLISQPGRLALLDAALCPHIDECALSGEAGMCAALPPSGHDPASLAAILYTSGSTGSPKGVMLSHANLWLGAVSVAHYLDLKPQDRVLGVLPLSFDYGQNQLLSTWYAGGTVVPLDYLAPRDVAKAVAREQITTLAGVPPLWVQLLDSDWPEEAARTIKRLTNSGGALTPALITRLQARFPEADIVPMYGLTEAFRSTYLDPSLVKSHPSSIGTAIPFAEVLIVRDDGSLCANEEAGELVHCGPLVAQGYWQDDVRTGERFKPAPPSSIHGGVAVWSGDKARRDANGLLYFIGRDDEMIKSSGNRISPTEIEDAAQASGLVSESVALGVPDERLGQAILLVAVLRNACDEAELRRYFKRELPSHMQPRDIICCDALPRNPNGKLDRAALRKEHAS